MAEDTQDDSSKTEEPSQKKLEEARKRGQMVSSREINHFFIILALMLFVSALSTPMAHGLITLLSPLIVRPDEIDINGAGFRQTMMTVVWGTLLALALTLVVTILAALAPAVLQKKWVFSAESIKPKFEKISPLAGFKRIYGMKAMVEFLKNLLKVSVVALIAVWVAWPHQHELMGVLAMPKAGMLEYTQHMAIKILIAVLIMLFLLSIADYLYQRFIFLKQMRMTRQELKDEYRQQEGDPHIKNKLRAIRREKARRRMMQNVPKADVVITNPTHYAVALQYDQLRMPAPIVLAKGADEVAARIRELATKSKVPIVRNPPLARILYDTTEIEEEIPVEHYQAVAKVIGYVYKMQGKVPKQGRADPKFRQGQESNKKPGKK